MGHQVSYTFVDLDGIQPLWGWSWRELFRLHPRARSRASELLEFALPEEELDSIDAILESEDVRETVGRLLPQFYCIVQLAASIPAFSRHLIAVETRFLEEPTVLVAAASGGFLAGALPKGTVKAVCKLHHLNGPRRVLKPPRSVGRRLGRMLSDRELKRPWFPWQSPRCCGYDATGWGTYDFDNCLGVADTRRFLRFFNRAWVENWDVPYFLHGSDDSYFAWGIVSVEAREGVVPAFRQFALTRKLARPVLRAERFARPALAFWKI
jgi:hypothetical protein